MAKTTKGWLPIFRKYLKHARIQSKHAESDPDGTGSPLELWTSQTRAMTDILNGLDDGKHVFYILKSRQLGVTTITLLILIFWLALHPNTIACLVTDDEKNARKNRATIEFYLKSLAPFMGNSFHTVKPTNRGVITFSNGSRLDLLVAGKSKENWGEGEGYLAALLTEVSAYGKVEGLESFRHAMAPDNPRALYIYESTAKSMNHWKDMWEAAREDEFSSVCIFVGWWANDLQRIGIRDRRYKAFGSLPPTPDEQVLIDAVKDQYDFDITMEQLAWYRWQQTVPSSGGMDMDQNQAWTESQCFIQSGISFFQVRLVMKRREEITSAEPAIVSDGGFSYEGYTFYLGDDYHLSKVEKLDPEKHTSADVKLRVWERPDPNGYYVIGCDPAYGRSELNDNHGIQVCRAFGDKLVQVAEWADNIPDTRHCAWVLAYLAGQYANCRINIDMTGGPGMAVMQQVDDLRIRMRSEEYAKKAEGFEDFMGAASWYLYRRVDSPGPGFVYNSKIGRDLKFRWMNILRDSWVTNLLELRSVPLLDEMAIIRQEDSNIGASAPGRQRDDRTFAMMLATVTWVENLRNGLIANGVTWDRNMPAAPPSPIAESLNRRIYSILRAQAENDDAPPARDFWAQRGIIA
jgi:hypothetical protein